MKKLHWFLFILSAILYAIPFLWSYQLWWLIFIFPVPLLYIIRTENFSFIHGYIWGIIVFSLHLHAGILIVANLAGDCWWIGFLIGIGMVLYQAFIPAILFWLATKIIDFLSIAVRVIKLTLLSRIFFCARPEPVEGYLRALGDILQQVQDERQIPFELHHYSKFYLISPLVHLLLWTAALVIFIFWTDQYCMWVFDMNGYPFMHPLLPLAQHPSLLQLLPIVGKQLLTIFFLLISVSIVIVLWYKNGVSVLLCISILMPWIWSAIHLPTHGNQPDWHKKIASLPCMIRAYTPNGAVRILTQHIKKLTAIYPEVSIIIMPESALDIVDNNILGKLHEACLQNRLHLILGACSCEDGNYFNSLYWIHNNSLQVRFDKKHVMLMTECLAQWMNADWLRTIYFKDDISITRSCNERKLLQLSPSISFVPYICSELFFNEYPDDCYPDKPIVAIINDTLLMDSYMHNLLLLLARFKAIQWQRNIVYVSYGICMFIDKQGVMRMINK